MNTKALLDQQRQILRDRLNKITFFDNEEERANFIIGVMKDLPYPNYEEKGEIIKEEAGQEYLISDAAPRTIYPKEFIDWLHGMSDKDYTERMYQRWLNVEKFGNA